MKVAVFLLGAGGTGKTTTRIAYGQGEPVQHKINISVETKKGQKDDGKLFYSLYDNCAVAGNLSTGTDANTSPEIIRNSFLHCLEYKDVVFIDGVMSSSKWVDMVNDYPGEMKVITVHYDFDTSEVYQRLLTRRASNGKVESELPEKTRKNSDSFIKRAANAVRSFDTQCNKPVVKLKVSANETTEQIVAKIKKAVAECLYTGNSQ